MVQVDADRFVVLPVLSHPGASLDLLLGVSVQETGDLVGDRDD